MLLSGKKGKEKAFPGAGKRGKGDHSTHTFKDCGMEGSRLWGAFPELRVKARLEEMTDH